MSRLFAFVMTLSILIPLNAVASELTEIARKAVKSTGQLEVFRVAPDEYRVAMKTLSILVAEAAETEEWLLTPSPKKEEPVVQKRAKELLAELPSNTLGRGTGWIWNQKMGLVVTNHHVVGRKSNHFAITFGNGTKAVLHFVGSDEFTDLALLKVVTADGPIPPALTVNSDCIPAAGEEVVSIGYPLPPREHVGKLPPWTLAYGRLGDANNKTSAFLTLQQVDNQLIQGFSGGPTLSSSCGVIGVNRLQSTSRIIPASILEFTLYALQRDGRVERGAIGMAITRVRDAIESGWFIEEGINPREYPAEGTLVVALHENMPAHVAGMKKGDVIIAFNGETVTEPELLQERIAATPPGETATLKVWRNGKEQFVAVQVSARPEKY